MTTTQTISVELTRPGPPAVLYASAGDQYSRKAALALYAGGIPYTPPAGTSCLIGWRRDTGAVGSYSQIMNPDGSIRPAWTLSGSLLTIELDWQLCHQAGNTAVNVALIGPDGSRLHTWEMICQVLPGAAADASDPARPNEAASSAAARAETAAAQAVQAANLLLSAADRAEAAADRAESYAPTDGQVLSVNGKGGAVTLEAHDVGAVAFPSSPVAGSLLAMDAIDPDTGAAASRSILAEGCGLTIMADQLRLTPASPSQLAAMADSWAPLVPALLPLAVKLALSSVWPSASWTEADREAVRKTIGAADALSVTSQLDQLLARVSALELSGGGGSAAVDQPYAADLGSMSGLNYSGVWNQVLQRLEF